MGKQSTRENKNIYQLCREAQGLTREKASELMDGVSESRIEKIEYGTQTPTPYDVIQMADCYKRPDLCNYFCSHQCLEIVMYLKLRCLNYQVLFWKPLQV